MVKSEIAECVFRRSFATCIRAVPRTADQSSTDAVPAAEPNDETETLRNVTFVVQDAGICLHGYTNTGTLRGADAHQAAAQSDGAQLLSFALLNVRRAFDQHPGVSTFIYVMDKGPFMPPPKEFVQDDRSKQSEAALARSGLVPMPMPASGELPVIVAVGHPMPPWCTVKANRALYRHATAEMLDSIVDRYTPPAGRRLVLDYMDRSAISPADLDSWMGGERLQLSDYARAVIDEARELLRESSEWRDEARELVKRLAQGGHVQSVPVCIETTLDGVRLAPFLLYGASNTIGEADVCIPFWLTAMRSERQHQTLSGERLRARRIDDDDVAALYYTDEQIAQHRHAVEHGAPVTPTEVPALMPLEKQRELARSAWLEMVAEEQARQAVSRVHEALGERGAALENVVSVRERAVRAHVESLGRPLGQHNECRAPNRGLVLSRDTDFLALLLVWQACLVRETGAADPQYAIDHAPLLSLGHSRLVHRTGWLTDINDYVEKKKQQRSRAKAAGGKRKAPGGDSVATNEDESGDEQDGGADEARIVTMELAFASRDARPSFVAQELYDVGRVERELAAQIDTETLISAARHATDLERCNNALGFATLTAMCGNDYLKGLPYVNRASSYKGWLGSACSARLLQYVQRQDMWLLDEAAHRDLVKRCYYESLCTAKSRIPSQPVDKLSYDDVARLWSAKWKNLPSAHMADAARLQLMYRRTQWWLSYAVSGSQHICLLIDHENWGWAKSERALRV